MRRTPVLSSHHTFVGWSGTVFIAGRGGSSSVETSADGTTRVSPRGLAGDTAGLVAVGQQKCACFDGKIASAQNDRPCKRSGPAVKRTKIIGRDTQPH